MAKVSDIQVRRDESASSGFAQIVEQYLRQNLDEFEDRRQRASKLRGRMAMTAEDYEQSLTLVFRGRQIDIEDGLAEPLDAEIAGPYQTLVDLIQGDESPLRAHIGRRIKVRSSLKKPFFPLHVHNLMKLESENEGTFVSDVAGLGVAGLVVILAAAALFYVT